MSTNMCAKIIYESGQEIGSYGNIFVKEVPSKVKGKRRAIFLCPTCGEPYEAGINTIKSDKQRGCRNCGKKKVGQAKQKDLTGQTFGYLTALYPLDERRNGNVVWQCKCKCGNDAQVIAASLISGKTKSCGCYSREVTTKNNTIDITGQKFGNLTAIRSTGILDEQTHMFLWEFKCDCGNTKLLPCGWVTCGNTTSCGCSKSRGESKVANLLNDLNISFKQQHSYEDCHNEDGSKKLYFDFYLNDYNCCLEYDGEQHFFANGRTWNTEEHCEQVKKRDEIKNNYCLKHHIPLIRIAYTSYESLDKDILNDLIQQAQKEGGIIRG